MSVELDLLQLQNVAITAPAGCGKTELIADALSRHTGPKPILVLTHTNAGVAALRARLVRANVPPSAYRLSTIDGWAIRLASMFPMRSGIDPVSLQILSPENDYPAIRAAAVGLLADHHINDVLAATYAKLFVDEYQDCTNPQHELICRAADTIPTVVLGDPLQAIFGWSGNEPPDWDKIVCGRFPVAGELKTPWRWKRANTDELGNWLLDVRRQLQAGHVVDLNSAPKEVEWICLNGTNDDQLRRQAAQTRFPDPRAKVIVLGDSRRQTHRDIARCTPGAITVEAVDLHDLIDFAKRLNFSDPNAALTLALKFASELMAGVGHAHIMTRVASIMSGTSRSAISEVEQSAIDFFAAPNPKTLAELLDTIQEAPGVRVFRTEILRTTFRALAQCDGTPGRSFIEKVVQLREQNRTGSRSLAKRSVGSTLLLKGLEAEVAVVLYADQMSAQNLYVAMTRGSKKLVICSKSKIITPK